MKRRRLLFEAEKEDGDAEFTASDEPEDGTGDSGGEEGTEDNTEDGGDDNGDEEGGDENADNDDFSIDAEPDEDGEGDDTGGDDTESDSGGGGGTGDGGPIDNEDTERDKELFSDLSPQEMKQKILKLKQLYMELYSNCNYIIEKLNSSNTPYEELNVQIKKALSTLFNLKQMISDYLLQSFDSKSYMENDIMFNHYLSVLNSVKKLTQEIDKSLSKEDEEENK